MTSLRSRSLHGTKPPRLDHEDALDEVVRLALELVRRDPLGQICREHFSTVGGQLRARLTLSAAEALAVPREAAVAWAVTCELLHNATLIHDDLQDRDPSRRGRPAVWKRHGDAQAINAGDLLLTLPYRAIELVSVEPGVRWSLTSALAERAEQTVRGQALEMTLLERRPWTRDEYDAAASGKTGALLALPIEGMAVVAGIDRDTTRAVGDAFRDLGLLYQLQDDVVDLYGDKQRGPRGSDVRQGKVTALVVEHVRLHPEDTDWLCEILSCPASLTSPEDVDAVAARFDESGAVAAVLQRALDQSDAVLSRSVLGSTPQLLALAQRLAARCLQPIESLLSERFVKVHADSN